MRRSTLTARLRVYDTGHDRVTVYYLDILDEQHFVGVWKRSQVAKLAAQFTRLHSFDAVAIQVVRVRSGAAS
ncbi:MAG: hypothetical protein H8E44_33040 [Planctomycetes bacterium]|nr:hypothetical protein [Planctomycetota bacterium]MBL7044452.1 hypothetical protein [Pirellulaceae bacterium]